MRCGNLSAGVSVPAAGSGPGREHRGPARLFAAGALAMAQRCLRWAAVLLVALVAGCGKNEPPAPNLDRYTPAPELARAAVEAVLTSWKTGQPVDPEGRLPKLVVTDKHRKEGQVLEEFEILGETPGDAKRCFAVKLKLSRPDEELRVRYAVIGIDPLLVFRHEDLEDIAQWDHPMPPEEDKEATEPASGVEPPQTEGQKQSEEAERRAEDDRGNPKNEEDASDDPGD